MNWEECSEIINDKKILFKDPDGGNTKFYLLNDDRIAITKIQVDNCLKLEGKRCDYLVKIDRPRVEIYIELKGCRVDDAFEQLENTIKQISQDCKKLLKYCYVIHTRCPPGTDIYNTQKKFKQNFNATLRVKSSGYEEDLKNLL